VKKSQTKKKVHLQEGAKATEAFETAMKDLFRSPKIYSKKSKKKGKD
jgi:hypothetical protein